MPGLKNSITLEPYQPLQLDIGAADVHNITDALRGLTRPETLHGNFKSPRGPGTTATKQVFIETLPPLLILHLKRFQYNNTGGTQKIWKRIGYPLELEIPKEVFPPSRRIGFGVREGLPRYKLTAVVYHHGKNASVGHYTVDVRRQDDREWIRMDDTQLRRVRGEDVAEEGGEEDARASAASAPAAGTNRVDSSKGRNLFDYVGDNGDDSASLHDAAEADSGGWKEVNGTVSSASSAADGSGSDVITGGSKNATTSGRAATATATRASGQKDSKVAYILFYQQI